MLDLSEQFASPDPSLLAVRNSTMNTRNLALAAALCCALSLYLWGEDWPSQVASAPQPNAEIAQSVAADSATVPGIAIDAQPDTEPTMEVEAADKPIQVAYEPPFPDRTNLFEAPKRQGSGRISSNGTKESAIELLGFVNVYGPEVVLSIDGLAATIAEGGSHAGIEVISIKPPAVFLQRGKQRWQASLEN